ncbi:phage tail assembly chaperone G [Paenibacillus oryzisoli]|uniref:Uncharacterized protein n=1 Tax=Paenibacillus oryzisoli TaxID=1850517 RepID=A0A198AI02_9BACL|nr:hypothetical protein [Paenibacillus oryzisoli]OAS21134.1 hypothetical protein A8708_30045 [Paenibacillus oryzisoli]
MQITLILDGKERSFTVGFVSGMMLRRTFGMQKKMAALNEESLDEAVDYVVDLYGKQFTRDDFYNGIDTSEVFDTITSSIAEVMQRTTKAVGAKDPDPNGQIQGT